MALVLLKKLKQSQQMTREVTRSKVAGHTHSHKVTWEE